MPKIIRTGDCQFDGNTGGNNFGLIERSEETFVRGLTGKWFSEATAEIRDWLNHHPRKSLAQNAGYNGSLPDLESFNRTLIKTGDQYKDLNQWFGTMRWLTDTLTTLESRKMIPTGLNLNAPRGIGTEFDSSAIRYSEATASIINGYSRGIWEELHVVDIYESGSVIDRYIGVSESGGTSWATINVWGDITIESTRRSPFVAGSDDQAILVNVFGKITYNGRKSLISSQRAWKALIVHDGAVIVNNSNVPLMGNGGSVFCLGSGRIEGKIR